MLAEFGHLSLIFALSLGLLATLLGVYASVRNQPSYINQIRPIYPFITFFLLLSLGFLGASFLNDDFSVQYVAMHSNTQLESFYKIAAVWGGHEGSFLFLLFALSFWSALVAWRCKTYPSEFSIYVLTTLGILILGIGSLILFSSNPFVRMLPAAIEGRDLNPMLQDIALIFHPPLLYIGYVGTAVGFAFAIAALLSQTPQWKWAAWLRPWVLCAWAFLTFGIMLGSWWAYYELGWGGFWFWDPVENASLMPWLLTLGLIHTLLIAHHKKLLHLWSLLLAIAAFAFSLLGTFIVRSGVMTSVHAFAADPTRGLLLLGLLSIVLIVSLSLFALKGGRYLQQSPLHSRSKPLLVGLGVCLLILACLIVLLGTLYPMFFQAFDLGDISVGAPYFNFFFFPLSVLICILIGMSYFSSSKSIRTQIQSSQFYTAVGLTLSLSLSYILYAYFYVPEWQSENFWVGFISVIAAIWVLITSYFYMLAFITQQNYRGFAAVFAHSGLAIGLIGICMMSYTSFEVHEKMGPGTKVEVNGYQISYQDTQLLIAQNYTTEKAIIEITDPQGEKIGLTYPEKRHYTVRNMPMTEAGILSDGLGDWYITLGNKLENQTYALRIQYKPFVRLIWYSCYLMVFGALIGLYQYLKSKGKRPIEIPQPEHKRRMPDPAHISVDEYETLQNNQTDNRSC